MKKKTILPQIPKFLDVGSDVVGADLVKRAASAVATKLPEGSYPQTQVWISTPNRTDEPKKKWNFRVFCSFLFFTNFACLIKTQENPKLPKFD